MSELSSTNSSTLDVVGDGVLSNQSHSRTGSSSSRDDSSKKYITTITTKGLGEEDIVTTAISGGAPKESRSIVTRFIDSFKPAIASDIPIDEEKDLDLNATGNFHEKTKLKQSMKSRHVLMMSLGTGIGTGLLVANGKCLHYGGPAALVISYALVSFVTYFVIQAVGEMAVAYPTLPGNYNAYMSNFISKPFAFATCWLYAIQWLTVMPLELITSSLVVQYWKPKANADVFVFIFYIFLVFIHFVGVRGYGETEFILNSCKILMISGFIIFAIVVNCGGAGDDGYIGAKYWHTPGAFSGATAISHLKGISYVLVIAYFSYGGIELYALSVNEQRNPRRSTPMAAKQSIYRIVIIYLLTMILVGFNVPYNSSELLGASTAQDKGATSNASPYVLAASLHGVKVIPDIINVLILLSILSVANSSLYAGPRLLASLAEQGFAPKFMAYIDRQGRPLFSLIVSCCFGTIAFAAASGSQATIFSWLAAIAGLSEIFTWSGIMLSHIRFRKAMKVQGKDLNEVGYLANTGVWGSYYGVAFNILVFVAQFWVALSPPESDGAMSVNSFFQSYLAFPLWWAFYFIALFYYKQWGKPLLIPLEEIDLDTHRRIYDPDLLRQEDEELKEYIKNGSFWVKMKYFWC